MSYQYAGLYAILKRVLGWLIFIPAFISTAVSLIGLLQYNVQVVMALMQ